MSLQSQSILRLSIPQDYIEPLAWLGKSEWITLAESGYIWSQDNLRDLADRSITFGRHFSRSVLNILAEAVCFTTHARAASLRQTVYTNRLFLHSKRLATGQKTLRLSHQWCQEFERTAITANCDDYRQPFEVMVIELPTTYTESRNLPGTKSHPECIVMFHSPKHRLFLFHLVFQDRVTEGRVQYDTNETADSLLDRIGTLKEIVLPDGIDFQVESAYLVPFYRIALNAMLAMTYGVGHHKIDPIQEERKSRKLLKQRASSNQRDVARRARLRLGILPEYFQFDQITKAFVEQKEAASKNQMTSGTPKKTHWRRGYWRNQAVGIGREQHKMTWIRPVLINADRFKGDIKDSSTTYIT